MEGRPQAVELLDIESVEEPGQAAYRPLRLVTRRGAVSVRFYPAAEAGRGFLCVGGAGGGWDTPAQGLYPRLCEDLRAEGIASLRVHFRNPHSLPEAVGDVLAGLAFLEAQGIGTQALAGHSLGGAVVIQAAAAVPTVRTVVALATQSYGAQPAAELAPRCSILLLHGMADEILPPSCSEHVYRIAGEPKQLILYPGARHVLDEAAEDIYRTASEWIRTELRRAP